MFPTKLIPLCDDYMASGSRVICNPAPTDTDEDWAVLSYDFRRRKLLVEALLAEGFEVDGKEYGDGTINFRSYRKGDINVIVIFNSQEYARFALATRIATALNLTNKEDRIALFSMIRETKQPYLGF